MPFGLKNAPAVFQRYMNLVTHGLENIDVYIDDIIIYSPDVHTHTQHLKLLFNRLLQYGLVINEQKSQFYTTKAKYLG